MIRLISFLILSIFILPIYSCTSKTSSKKLIISSVKPLALIIQEITGSLFEVKTLLKPGASPHTFEPSSEEMRLIENASIYIKNGTLLELEVLIDSLIKPYPKLKIISAGSNIQFLPISLSHHHHSNSGNYDPHIWVSPKNALIMAESIKKQLSDLYPQHQSEFEERWLDFKKRLTALDSELKKNIQDWRYKKVVEMHPAWGYFARDYGLEIIGSIQKHSGHDETVSLKDFQELIHEAKSKNAEALLIEPEFGQSYTEKISKEIQLKIIVADPEGSSAGNYINFILQNYHAMEKVLK